LYVIDRSITHVSVAQRGVNWILPTSGMAWLQLPGIQNSGAFVLRFYFWNTQEGPTVSSVIYDRCCL